MRELFHVVYFSEAAEDLSYTDIKEILEVSRINNARDQITGVLIYRDGFFLQLLEGKQADVQALFARIKEDDRNYRIKVLVEGPCTRRLFPDWVMAFHDGDLSSNHNHLLEKLFAAPKTFKPSEIVPLLEAFKDLAPEFK